MRRTEVEDDEGEIEGKIIPFRKAGWTAKILIAFL